jgi:mannosyltransferase
MFNQFRLTPFWLALRSKNATGLSRAIVFGALSIMVLFVVLISQLLYIHQSLRLDEAQSMWQTSHSVGRMLQLVAQDVHVPLYHFMLHFWQIAFGNDVTTVRYLSLVMFAAVIPATYLLARQIFTWQQSLLAAGLVCISPFMNWYGNEARMYLLLTLMTIINQIFFIRIIQKKPGAWWGYVATAVIGSYSHYFFGFVLLTQGLFYLANFKSFAKDAWLRFAGVAAAVAAGLTPWLLYVHALGSANSTRPHLIKPSSVDLFNTFAQFFFGFQDDRINTLIVSLWPIMILLGFLAIQKQHRFSLEISYLGLAAFVPILGAFGISLFVTPLYISRYLIVALPALYLLLIWLISGLPRKLPAYVLVVLVAAMTLTLGHQAASADTPVKEEYQQAAQYVSTLAGPTDVVVLSAPFTIYPVEYYYSGPAPLETLPQWDRFSAGDAPSYRSSDLPAQVGAIKGDRRDAWLILSYDQGNNKEILRYYDQHYERLLSKNFSPGLAVYEFKLRYDTPDTPGLVQSLNR